MTVIDERAEYAALMVGFDDYLTVDELLAEALRRPAWHALASCAGMGTRTFFVERGESPTAARKVCAGCPVRLDCATVALEQVDTEGLWAGTSPKLRRRARVEGWDAVRLVAEVDAARVRDASPSAWKTEPCLGCGGNLSRKDLARGDGCCWACR